MTRVFERLFLGNAADAERLAIENPFDITAVVNVSSRTNRLTCAGVDYVHVGFDESESVPPAKFKQALTAIARLIPRGTVLVHCEYGSSRAPVVVALYMHTVGYKNFADALFELRDLRSVVALSTATLESARRYLRNIEKGQVPRAKSR